MAYNTGNPIGSTDPRDLYDNAQNLDELTNSQSKLSHPDRRGVSRKTWHGMEEEFDADQARRENEFVGTQADKQQRFNLLLANSGYEYLADYAAGIEITEYNQVLRDPAGELWRAAATTTLPYTTDGTGLPEGGAFVAVGDADIRNDLAAGVSSGKGGLLVRGAVIYVDTIADLQALDTSALVDGQQVQLKEYHAGTGVGGGGFYWDAVSEEVDNGGTVIQVAGVTTGRWKRIHVGYFTPSMFGAVGDGVADDTMPLFSAIAYINDIGGGCTLSLDGGVYGVGAVNTSSLPSGGWRDVVKSMTQCVLYLVGVSDLLVTGPGEIRTLDDGTPTTNSSNGIFQLNNCHDVRFSGFHLDGNRLNQTHTIGTTTGHNHGFYISATCSNIAVEDCFIENLGSLRTGTDKRGDAIYVQNGSTNIFFRRNTVKNVGRWCCVLERGAVGTDNYVIEDNIYYGANRRFAPANPDDYEQECMGFVDLESYRDHSNIIIRNNTIYRSGAIAVTGSNSSFPSAVVKNLTIEGNVWNSEEIGGRDGRERVVSIGTTGSTVKTIENFIFKGNTVVYGSEALGVSSENRILSLESSVFSNVTICDNSISQYSTDTGYDSQGMHFNKCRLLGTIRYARNSISVSSAIKGWFGFRSSWGASDFEMYVHDNVLTNGHQGIWWLPSSEDTAKLYVFNNRINATNKKSSDLMQGARGTHFVYVDDLPLTSATPPPTVNVRSSVKVGDTLTPCFWVAPTEIDASVLMRVAFDINDNSRTCGYLEFDALYNSGIWTVGTVKSQMTNATPPTVTVDGDNLVISMRKMSSGALASPTIRGLAALCNAELKVSAP